MHDIPSNNEKVKRVRIWNLARWHSLTMKDISYKYDDTIPVAYTGKWANPFELSRKTWLFLGLSGLATGASWVCYFRALKLGETSKVAPVDKLSLVLVAVFAFTFLGERPSLREWTGIAMVAGGVLLLAFKR